ncbi:hypothetical protein BC828DRAFT_404550 [Blastocladiella britannica]|nr:hypothetical protein BC828DRAFT_404550 [Blastocladiella britannica]
MDMVAQDPGAKVVVFCKYQQQINLIHDALVVAGTRCAALRQGVQSYPPLREFKCGLAPEWTRNVHPIKTTPVPVLVMPYSVCSATLSLVEATHVIMSHPYTGIDQSLTLATPRNPDNRVPTDFGCGNWKKERWEYERLKWSGVPCRALSDVPGQTRSVQVIRLYAVGTRESALAQQFGDPLATAPGSGVMAAVDQDRRNRFEKDWSRPGTVRSADAIMYSKHINGEGAW